MPDEFEWEETRDVNFSWQFHSGRRGNIYIHL